ncbi:MltR family transcriptional regulator [Shigella flexneri]
MKPLLAESGPLDDIDVALCLIYALGKWINGRMPISRTFPSTGITNQQDEMLRFADDMTWDSSARQ